MSELKSNRAKDSELEKAIQKHYNLVYRINGIPYKRCDDTELQLKGQDLSFTAKSGQKIVDEKCATNYWNKPLNTFAMEMSFDMCDRQTGEPIGKRYDGWFINPDNISTTYSLGYVKAKSQEDLSVGRLESFECIIVEKKAINDYLCKAFNVNDIYDAEEMFLDMIDDGTASQNDRGGYFWKVNNDIKMVRSDNLAERPLNIVINKATIAKMSDIHCRIEYHTDGFNYSRISKPIV